MIKRYLSLLAVCLILAGPAEAQTLIPAGGSGGGGGGAPTGPAGGDLGGTYPNPSVISVGDVTTGVLAPANGGSGVANTGNLTWNAAQTLSFTSAQTMTFPAVSDTLAGLATAQTFSAVQTFGPGGASTQQIIFTPNSGVGGGLGMANNGSQLLVFTNNAPIVSFATSTTTLRSDARLAWGSTTNVTSTTDTFLSRHAAANAQLGAADAAAPVAQTLSAQSVITGTTNTSSPNLTFVSPLSTGTGTAGDFILQTGTVGLTGSTPNAAATAMILKGGTQSAIFPAAGALSAPALSVTGAPITGGTTTTNKPLMLIETAGATSNTWTATGTMLGVNSPSGFTGVLADLQANGASALKLTTSGVATLGGSLIVAGTGQIAWSFRGMLTSPAAGSVQFGAADAAAPVAQIITAQSVVAGTSNTAGTNTTIIGSRSTGSGASGDIILQTGGTGAGATVQNTATTALTIKGASQHLAFGGAAPAVTSCGTGSPSVSGSDNAGVITIGTTATSCTLTFKTAYAATPVCVLSDQTTLANLTSYTLSNSAMVLTMVANSGNLVNYICTGA